MTKQFFGTDGIRGRVGVEPMTPERILKLGWAAGRVLADSGRPRVIIGKDTRLSGYLYESALEAGFSAAGVNVSLLGPMPTPAIAYLTRTFRAQAGVVISASHNPFHDNGVKFFGADGAKLPDEIEHRIEKMMHEPLVSVAPEDLGRARRINDAPGRYIEFCKGTFRQASLLGYRVVVDSGHGATYHVATPVFAELGAQVFTIGNQPDGLNINQGCGSTDVSALQAEVLKQNAHIGVALDGDGDRCILVDHTGRVVDGDEILYVLARARQAESTLLGPVVGTVMTNLGVELALKRNNIEFQRAAVGDRYVMEMLRATGGMLGGESSGHIVCLDRTTTGDGIVSALQVLAVMAATGFSLSELVTDVEKCPQVLINVPISGDAKQLVDDASVKSVVADVESDLGESGRVLLRPSGTEPLIRVMVEGQDADQVKRSAERIADQVREVA